MFVYSYYKDSSLCLCASICFCVCVHVTIFLCVCVYMFLRPPWLWSHRAYSTLYVHLLFRPELHWFSQPWSPAPGAAAVCFNMAAVVWLCTVQLLLVLSADSGNEWSLITCIISGRRSFSFSKGLHFSLDSVSPLRPLTEAILLLHSSRAV